MTMSTKVGPPPARDPLPARRTSFEDIPRAAWERLYAATPSATPFSRWTFHRAWWDAYRGNADDHYLVVSRLTDGVSEADDIAGIIPLMVRPAAGGTIFMAASYHADYATVLAAPDDIGVVATAAVAELASARAERPQAWSMIDLRRLRADDPALVQLQRALESAATQAGWTVRSEIEDVCPVVALPSTLDELLRGLGSKARHEVRRKLRRAEAHGPVELTYLPLDRESADRFIDLHQARWGEAGLFRADAAGAESRRFFHRLVELEAAEGEDGRLHLGAVRVDGRVIYVVAGFAEAGTCYFYNAGMDPAAASLSPGVVGTLRYIEHRIEVGDRRLDLLRGDEAYKYSWGATDDHVHRLTVRPDMPAEASG